MTDNDADKCLSPYLEEAIEQVMQAYLLQRRGCCNLNREVPECFLDLAANILKNTKREEKCNHANSKQARNLAHHAGPDQRDVAIKVNAEWRLSLE